MGLTLLYFVPNVTCVTRARVEIIAFSIKLLHGPLFAAVYRNPMKRPDYVHADTRNIASPLHMLQIINTMGDENRIYDVYFERSTSLLPSFGRKYITA